MDNRDAINILLDLRDHSSIDYDREALKMGATALNCMQIVIDGAKQHDALVEAQNKERVANG